MQQTAAVRLKSIEIKNFKNVGYGKIDLVNNRKDYRASILGLYGQNGSGKTALIDALGLLKCCLGGWVVPNYYADFINVDAENSYFEYVFTVKAKDCNLEIFYSFCLGKKQPMKSNDGLLADNELEKSAIIYNEIVSYSMEEITTGKKTRKAELINTCDSNIVFTPAKRYECFFGKSKNVATDLLVLKKMAYKGATSFVFSREFLNHLNDIVRTGETDERLKHSFVLNVLSRFGLYELFVIDSKTAGVIALNMLPISFRLGENLDTVGGRVGLFLEKAVAIPEKFVAIAEKVIANMNVVLSQIIPGLTISVKKLGLETLSNGETGCKVELMSNKNSKEIPLRNESEGIKKIVSILQLLIVVYNQPSITVAVDELDAGVFEYMLGELLKIISDGGKGQLIFTSHNLRPLETLDWVFVGFTTVNPKNRYVRSTSLKSSNNLRDVYYRKIMLGSDAEELYNATNNAEIAFAFREAGDKCGL